MQAVRPNLLRLATCADLIPCFAVANFPQLMHTSRGATPLHSQRAQSYSFSFRAGIALDIQFSAVAMPSSVFALENEKFFELKSKEYRDGIKRKETR